MKHDNEIFGVPFATLQALRTKALGNLLLTTRARSASSRGAADAAPTVPLPTLNPALCWLFLDDLRERGL